MFETSVRCRFLRLRSNDYIRSRDDQALIIQEFDGWFDKQLKKDGSAVWSMACSIANDLQTQFGDHSDGGKDKLNEKN